jgi:hypothetical protein
MSDSKLPENNNQEDHPLCREVIEANAKIGFFEESIKSSFKNMYKKLEGSSENIQRYIDNSNDSMRQYIDNSQEMIIREITTFRNNIQATQKAQEKTRKKDKKDLKKFVKDHTKDENKWIKKDIETFKGKIEGQVTGFTEDLKSFDSKVSGLLVKTAVFSGIGLIVGMLGGFAVTYLTSR